MTVVRWNMVPFWVWKDLDEPRMNVTNFRATNKNKYGDFNSPLSVTERKKNTEKSIKI